MTSQGSCLTWDLIPARLPASCRQSGQRNDTSFLMRNIRMSLSATPCCSSAFVTPKELSTHTFCASCSVTGKSSCRTLAAAPGTGRPMTVPSNTACTAVCCRPDPVWPFWSSSWNSSFSASAGFRTRICFFPLKHGRWRAIVSLPGILFLFTEYMRNYEKRKPRRTS